MTLQCSWPIIIWICLRYHRQAVFRNLSTLKVRSYVRNPPVLLLHAGVLEDSLGSGHHLDAPEMAETGYVSNFVEIEGQEHCQEPPCPPSPWWSLGEQPWVWTPSGCARDVINMICFHFCQDWMSGTWSRTPWSSISIVESWRIGWSLDTFCMCQR